MTKKADFYEKAESLYVNERHTLKEISEKFPVSLPSLSVWKREGNWGAKRDGSFQNAFTFHIKLYEFSKELMAMIRSEIEAEGRVDLKALSELEKILGHIPKIKQYEAELGGSDAAGVSAVLDEETIKEINSKVLGIE